VPVAVPVSFVCDRGAFRVGEVEKDGLVVGVPNGVASGIDDVHVVESIEVEVTIQKMGLKRGESRTVA